MARLTNLKPRLGLLPARIGWQPTGSERDYDRHRSILDYRKWYKTAAWQKLRQAVLLRDLYTCTMCGRVEPDTSRLVADHKHPHRGDRQKFFDASNVQCVCKPCHDGAKQRLEQRRPWGGG